MSKGMSKRAQCINYYVLLLPNTFKTVQQVLKSLLIIEEI